MKKNYIILVLLFLALFCSAVNIYLISVYKTQREANIASLLRNYKILLKTNDLISLLKDAEASQRAFLLNGEEGDQVDYFNTTKRLTLVSQNLSEISGREEKGLKTKIYSLLQLVKSKTKSFDETISLYKSNRLAPSINIILAKDKISMQRARSLASQVVFEENQMVMLNNKKLEKDYSFNSIVQYTNLIFIFFMLAGTIIILNRRKKYIVQLVADLKLANQNLESQVQERTQELLVSNEKLLKANEELFDKNELYKQSNELVEFQNKYLIEINDQKNKFIGMAAHDLKSPLVSIKGLVDLFKMDKEELSDEHNEYLDYISEASCRMLKLISNVLNVNKIEMGDITVGLEKFNIYPFIQNIVYGYKAVTAQKNIKIILENCQSGLEINSDKTMLAQIIENLLSNAIKFSPFDKNIFVRIYKERKKIKIEVEDQGLGIQKEELPHVFDKFNRISTRPTNGEDSTGLGLSIVKGMLEDLNGKIEVESEVNKGTKFTLVFNE